MQGIEAEGACIDDGNAKEALFTYRVLLSGSYNKDQRYYYEFKGNKALDEYEVSEIYVNGDKAKQLTVNGAEGTFVIPEGTDLGGDNSFTVEVGGLSM